MRVLILSLPALFTCGGVLWMFFATIMAGQKAGRVAALRRVFCRMSIAVGILFLLWAVAVLFAGIVAIAYPLVLAFVGLLLIVQGWAFNRLQAF